MATILDKLFSVYFNFRYLPFSQAKRLPILINHNCSVIGLKRGDIFLSEEVFNNGKWSIILGLHGAIGQSMRRKNTIYIQKNEHCYCSICFNGRITIGEGFTFRIIKDGVIIFGRNNFINSDSTFVVGEKLVIGDNNLMGWNILFKDTDVHHIVRKDGNTDNRRSISVGNHNWICANSIFNRGVELGSESVVANGAFLNKSFSSSVLIGGIPARVIKEHIEWEDE